MATGSGCFKSGHCAMSNPVPAPVNDIYPWLAGHWSFFSQRFDNNRLAHAIMIEGPAGSGKKSLARAMCAKLLCIESSPEACGNCRSCNLLPGGAHPDYFEIQPEEEGKVIKVDQIRALIGRLDLTTSIARRKVAYIHPADAMNISSANALLKSLEEPAGETILILVSDNPGRLPVTIRSRCQSITINQPDNEVLLDWLQQQSSAPEDRLVAALQAAGHSPLKALQYLDSPDLEAFAQVREGLRTLLNRPASVSMVSSGLNELNPGDLWRWLSLCTTDVIKSKMLGNSPEWLAGIPNLHAKPLLELQKQADINRQLSATPVRGDLLLQDWLIRWAQQAV
jgi:DNA polymerase-3 subunit delta'